MARLLPGLLLPAAFVLLPGCVNLRFERARDGHPGPVGKADRLVARGDSLRATLERLGSPDLILKSGDRDRLYYLSWDSDFFKVVFSAPIPVGGRSFSWDIFTWGTGDEVLHVARLDFSRDGRLAEKQIARIDLGRSGKSVALDNSLITNVFEERSRILGIRERPDDEDDEDLQDTPDGRDPPPQKSESPPDSSP